MYIYIEIDICRSLKKWKKIDPSESLFSVKKYLRPLKHEKSYKRNEGFTIHKLLKQNKTSIIVPNKFFHANFSKHENLM